MTGALRRLRWRRRAARLVVDEPDLRIRTRVRGRTTVTGWAAAVSRLARVEVSCDGLVLGAARLGLARPDVAAAYRDLVGAGEAGYAFLWDAGAVIPGPHRLAVTAVDESGRVTTVAGTVVVEPPLPDPPFHLMVDQPDLTAGRRVGRAAIVSGWALSAFPPVRVEVLCDGVRLGDPRIGLARPDVAAMYPDLPRPHRSGYWFRWDASALALGPHVVTVRAIDAANRTEERTGTVVVSRRTPGKRRLQARLLLAGLVDGLSLLPRLALKRVAARPAGGPAPGLAEGRAGPVPPSPPRATPAGAGLPRVSVVVLNYDGLRFLDACFSSLVRLDYPEDRLELLMVDNGSSDGSLAFMRERFPTVRIIELASNTGFSVGNNAGLRASTGDFVLVLNNDTDVDKHLVRAMVGVALDDARVGIVAPKILFRRRPGVINNAGSFVLTSGWGVDRGFGQPDRGQYDRVEDVFAACGACILCRRTMLSDVGLFDEHIFAYFEDTDLCWRARLRGWTIVYTPEAVVHHEHSGTAREWSPFFAFNVFRNRVYIALKLGSRRHATRVAGDFARETLTAVGAQLVPAWRPRLPGHQPFVGIRLRAMADLVRHAGDITRERRRLGADGGSRRAVERALVKRLRVGIYNSYLNTRGGAEKYMCALAERLARRHTVELVTHEPVDLRELERQFDLDLSKTGIRYVSSPGIGGQLESSWWPDVTSEYDVLLAYTHDVPFGSRARRSILVIAFPFEELGEGGGPLGRPWHRVRLQTYDKVIAISEFTRDWIGRRWGVKAEILLPPLEPPTRRRADRREELIGSKRPLVLHVGRFFTGQHEKRQDVLIEVFERMCDRGLRDWELHLAGVCDPEHERFLGLLRSRAKGYPIQFHVDCDREELARLYEESSLYWHATGFGTDPELEPEKQEHFGITTCEAMSMGCVPIVIRRGGQPEIVEPGRSGYLWDGEADLERYTRLLAENADLRRELALNAVDRFDELARRRERQLESLLRFIEA